MYPGDTRGTHVFKKNLVSMLASVSAVFSSFGLTCYSCVFSRGFKSFSLWLTARSCSLYVDVSEALVFSDLEC